ncbi:uncharacterized protein LOC123716662 [Pieris brassicae]|uniref:uncharacterized protein LOC123716662 n=1 Tax=Pieris brassicae TaxID=7116 RepID=UPI001E65ED3B|nr:uncharacterized protein LOC123716662 [Pieris brassicae]
MDLDEVITVTKINTLTECLYLLIGWQRTSFEIYIYAKEKVWKGKFSPNRLASFSRNLQISEKEYFNNLKQCLSLQKNNYVFELKSGFFYWKRKVDNTIIIEGFLPVETDTSPKNMQPDLVEVLLALNKQLTRKAYYWEQKCRNMHLEYEKCLKDTEEFLNLKIDMEKALCDKFLNLLKLKKEKFLESRGNNKKNMKFEDIKELLEGL